MLSPITASTPTKSLSFQPPFSCSSSFLRINFSLLLPSSPSRTTRIMISAHQSIPLLPDDRIVVGCGGASMDYLVMVDGFPKPDEKIRGTLYKVQGGGNVGNALTCAARLGLRPRIISKVAEDAEGRGILEELEADGYPPMMPTDFSGTSLSSALDGVKLVYFDGLSLKTALVVAREACRRSIPILVDAEMGEEGFDNLLNMSDYAVCSAKYPQAWTKAPSMASALVSMLIRLPKLKFGIVTLGEEGCIMLQRSHYEDDPQLEEMNVDQCLASLNKKKDCNTTTPTCISSSRVGLTVDNPYVGDVINCHVFSIKPVLKLEAPGLGKLSGKFLVGTAERIPQLELVDTTGAGDAFVGAVLYALCTDMPPEKMLPFAAQVAAGCCRAFGARTGLPHHTDPRLQLFLDHDSSTSPAL